MRITDVVRNKPIRLDKKQKPSRGAAGGATAAATDNVDDEIEMTSNPMMAGAEKEEADWDTLRRNSKCVGKDTESLWAAHYNEEYDRMFYYNSSTGESSWTEPPGFQASQVVVQQPADFNRQRSQTESTDVSVQ